MISDPRPGAPAIHAWWLGDQGQVGAFLHGYESLWLPAALLRQDHQRRLADALFAASRHKKVELHFNKGDRRGACHSGVLVIIADGERPPIPDSLVLRWTRPPPAGTRMKLILPRHNCARLLRTPVPMFLRATM